MYKILILSLTSYISVFCYLDIFPTITTKPSNISDSYQKLAKAVLTNKEVSTTRDYIQLMIDNYKEIAITTNPKSRKHVSFFLNNLKDLPEITTILGEPSHVEARSLDGNKRDPLCHLKNECNSSKNNKHKNINSNRNGISSAFPVKFVKLTTRKLCPSCNKKPEINSKANKISEIEYDGSKNNGRKDPIIEINFPITQESVDSNEAEVTTNDQNDNIDEDEDEYEGITKVTSYEVFTLIEKSQYSNNISDSVEELNNYSSFDNDQMNFSKTMDALSRQGKLIDESNETMATMEPQVTAPISCVFCNNIDNANCNKPLNKM